MSIASHVNAARKRYRFPADGMPARGISGVLSRRFVCKHFATALAIGKMRVFRSVFFRRLHARAEKNDSAATGNTDCQQMRAG
ncbi:hypothetical protein [uncultured Bacteroides sp.]|uniref:hypothetical protein n=1 Tax=uncultured Bacteroides sp. TaxID=162156 RepID=UPI0025D1586C|nr:hypothetical protein [uncultured Bacteroides sp.]